MDYKYNIEIENFMDWVLYTKHKPEPRHQRNVIYAKCVCP